MSDVPGKDLLYNQLAYCQYRQRLEAVCNRNKHAAKVLCSVFKDPVTSFLEYNPNAAALFADAEKPSEADIKDDPQTNLTTFVKAMLGKAVDGGAGFTESVKERLEDKIANWMVGESTIFSIAAESLKHHPKLISSKVNAGRSLLDKLDDYHKVNNKETTRVLLRAFHSFCFQKLSLIHI